MKLVEGKSIRELKVHDDLFGRVVTYVGQVWTLRFYLPLLVCSREPDDISCMIMVG